MAPDLREVVSILHSGDWCSLTFVTANVKKGTGGKVVNLQKCRLARRQPALAAVDKSSTVPSAKKKDPNHALHFTRNVELQNKNIITIHPVLITIINNKTVI
jgi:hypothetical protein